MRLDFGLHLPIHGAYDYNTVLETSILADELGYDYITVGDHFFLPSNSYRKLGGDPDKPDKLDAWVTLSALAAKTKRVKLGTRVSPIPFYLPSRLAKIVTTVDIVSGGRAVLGVGAGWYKEEAVSYGIRWGSHKKRIERMLEGLEIILKLWLEEKATFQGKHYRVCEAPFWPKPVQKPHPPIWFGGSSSVIVDATAKHGDGLFPTTDIPLDRLEKLYSRVRVAEKRYDRNSHVMLGSSLSYPNGIGEKPSEWVETVESQKKIGASLVLVDFSTTSTPPAEAQSFLKGFAREIPLRST
jgi:alkanesulfonate monooxygenase SsuD/methylene tetrahydromethanopterin reductase-like flavin-dependent oxidoreductase (luciferase family)